MRIVDLRLAIGDWRCEFNAKIAKTAKMAKAQPRKIFFVICAIFAPFASSSRIAIWKFSTAPYLSAPVVQEEK